jgi:iron complex transport system ATP-binding protein
VPSHTPTPAVPLPPDTPLLELTAARVVRGRRTILDVDHFALWPGERVAILGPNGAGKSTLVGLLTRDIRPLAPQDPDSPPPVRLAGRSLWNLFDARRLLGVVSASLQSTYDLPVTVRDTVLSGFFGSIGLRQTHRPTAEQIARADELLAEVGATELADRRLDTLSTGEARRALVARALVNDPPVLVLDEPCDGLDPAMTWRFLETAVRPLARSGRTLLLVTHHVDDIVPEVDRVVLLANGRMVADGLKSEILTAERLSELYGFEAKLEQHSGWYRLWWGDE